VGEWKGSLGIRGEESVAFKGKEEEKGNFASEVFFSYNEKKTMVKF